MTHPDTAAHTPLNELPTGLDIRLIAMDMDGTLLDDDKNFPEGLWDVWDACRARGITLVPASGRQAWTLSEMFSVVGDDLTIIAENGAFVMRGGQEVSSSPLDHATVRQIIQAVRQRGADGIDLGLVVCGKRAAYLERTDAAFVDSVAVYYVSRKCVPDQIAIIDAIESGDLDDEIIKLALFCPSGAVHSSAAVVLEPYVQTHQVVVSGHQWADLQAQGVDKGDALLALQQALGVTPDQTAVFGDFHNDLGMMEHATWSFAMVTGHADVRAAARYIAPSHNEAGVLQVIRRLLGIPANSQ